MFKIILSLLVLSAGAHSRDIQNNIKLPEVNEQSNAEIINVEYNTASITTVNLKVVEQTSDKKSTSTVTSIDSKIGSLADKILRIHGVRIDQTSEENNRNIEKLKQLVADIQKNLDVKLQEMRK